MDKFNNHMFDDNNNFNIIIKRSKNDQIFTRGIKKNWVITICDPMFDVNDNNICASWLMYYLGTKNEYNFFKLPSS